MQTEILYRPSYSLAMVSLAPRELIRVEAGSMVSMSGVTLETRATGGILSALKRSLLGGESFFMNEYTAGEGGGQIGLAPALPGDMVEMQRSGERALMVQSGSFVASSQAITVDTSWGGARTFFANEGFFLLRCSGAGDLLLSSYGAIHATRLEAGQQLTVDTGHLVAFEEGIGFSVRAVGGLKSTLFSGEGLVVDLTGPGDVWLQTRSSDALLAWLVPQVQRRMPSNHHN